jgi:uroporphyrinogen decarboxylase
MVGVKSEFGTQVSFIGGIDISHAMLSSQTDVVEEVKRRIQQLGDQGGYILAPSNHLQADVPPENVATLFKAALEFGKYPLKGAFPL